MIHKLEPSAYHRVQPLLEDMDHHLSILSLLAGLSPGEIYVDDVRKPKSVFGWSMRRFFLVGESGDDQFNQGVRDYFMEVLYPNASELGMGHFALHYGTVDWENVIDFILEGKNPVKEGRHYYAARELNQDWQALIPEGFNLHPIDRALLEQTHLGNLDRVTEEMQSERSSVEDFLEKSFGYCIVREDAEIVAWCMSEYNCADRCEAGIETLEDYQRRGLGTVTASAVVEHALSNGISQAGWHCYASNMPSIATALKVGFEKACEYTEYWALFDEALQLAIKGNKCLQHAAYDEAVTWYERSLAAGQSAAWLYWNTASAYAYLDDAQNAFKYLNLAVEHGFSDAEYFKNSKHFVRFHDTEDWKTLINKLEV